MLAAGWGWMSIGSISTTGLRSVSARWYARCASSAAVFGLWTRSAIAPTDSTRSCWSMRKFDVSAAAGVSPASTSTGVRLLAASLRPVIVFVSPGPWWTLTTPTRPVTRAYPSAMQTAPHSWREWWKRAPPLHSALVTIRLPLPMTPNASCTPCEAIVVPTTSATDGAFVIERDPTGAQIRGFPRRWPGDPY